MITAILGYHLLLSIYDGESIIDLPAKEIAAFLCFPMGLMLGLVLGLKKEFWGGVIATLSLAILFVLRADLLESNVFRLMLLPGFLYLWLSLGNRKKA